MINIKAPTGTRLELTNQYIKQVEADIRQVVPPDDLGMIVSNIGITPDFSAIYTSNSGQHTAFVQVSLKEDHKVGSYEYMRRVRAKLSDDLPELSTYFQSGGLVDAVVNLGLPAPIDIQVSGSDHEGGVRDCAEICAQNSRLRGVSDVLIPQDLDYPGIKLDVNREMAARLGLSSKEVVDNVITALTSDGMIAPSYWVDPKNGNNYMLTVQYPETQVNSLLDLKQIPLRCRKQPEPHRPRCGDQREDHQHADGSGSLPAPPRDRRVCFAVQRRSWRGVANRVDKSDRQHQDPRECARHHARLGGRHAAVVQELRHWTDAVHRAGVPDPDGAVRFVHRSASSFCWRFRPGITGVMLFLLVTDTTLNVMSLMGVIMMTGIVVSNSILIVEFTRSTGEQGMPIEEAVATRVPGAFASRPDDLAGDDSRHDSDGSGAGGRQRAVCSAGARDYRRARRCRWS